MAAAPTTARRSGRLVRSVALTAVLVLGATACSGGDGASSSSSSGSSSSDAKRAGAALRKGYSLTGCAGAVI